jgi:hypothetical protein
MSGFGILGPLLHMIRLPAGLHGAYLRPDLEAHLGRSRLRSAINEGRLLSYSRTVVIMRDRMQDLRTLSAAALLMAGPEAVLTSHTSAHLHGCTAADVDRVHLLISYDRKLRLRPGLAVHYGNYDPADVVELEGLRCLTLDATIAELLCRGRRSTALACADQALAFADGRGEFKADVAARLADRPDPRGKRRGEFLLDIATGLPESPPESWLLLKIVDAGFPAPEPQYRIHDLAGRLIYRLDFAWPDRRVAVEYDGYEAHEHRHRQDTARDEDLHRRGWKVIRADASDLRDPTRLFARLSAELGVPERSTRGA